MFNYYICEKLEEMFGRNDTYDYTVAVGNMIKEAKKMDKEFTLSDLPTFAGVAEFLKEHEIKDSPAQVKARFGKIFNEAVRKGTANGVVRATTIKNGEEHLKFYSRAAVYVNKLEAKRCHPMTLYKMPHKSNNMITTKIWSCR